MMPIAAPGLMVAELRPIRDHRYGLAMVLAHVG